MTRDAIYLLSQPKEVWLKVASIDTRMCVSCVFILLETTCVSCKYEGDIYCRVVTASATPFEPNLIRKLHKTATREQLKGSLYNTEEEEWWGARNGRQQAPRVLALYCLIQVQNSLQQHFCLTAWRNSSFPEHLYIYIEKCSWSKWFINCLDNLRVILH
jgi:hypothetical protein